MLEDQLIRFVGGPDGQLVPDLKCKLPGRGVWVEAKSSVLTDALQTGRLPKALKAKFEGEPQDIIASILKRLNESILGGFGLARRAGHLISGFEKVLKNIDACKVAVLIEASDGAEGGVRKLRHRALSDENPVKVYVEKAFDTAELSSALGHPNIVHAAVLNSRSVPMIKRAIKRRDYFLSANGDATP